MALILSPQMMVSVTCPMEVTEAVAHSRAKSTIRGVLTWGSTALGSLALSMSVCWLSLLVVDLATCDLLAVAARVFAFDNAGLVDMVFHFVWRLCLFLESDLRCKDK